VQRFRGGLVFKVHRRLYHSTLGLRVIKKKGVQFAEEIDNSRRQLDGLPPEATNSRRLDSLVLPTALGATQGQNDSFCSQLPYTFYLEDVASVGD